MENFPYHSFLTDSLNVCTRSQNHKNRPALRNSALKSFGPLSIFSFVHGCYLFYQFVPFLFKTPASQKKQKTLFLLTI